MHKLIPVSITLFIICSAFVLPPKNATVKGEMYFSTQPFTTSNAGSKKIFTSSDYIYGRIELEGKTIKEAFKVFEPNSNYPHSYLLYRVYIFRNGEEMGFNPSVNICLLKEQDKNNTWLNFDVLPEPSKATTVLSGTGRFVSGLSAAPLYGLINNNNFSENGEYKIVVKFYTESQDVWGNMEDVEKWPNLEESFTFVFNEKDVPLLKKNETAANAMIEQNAFKNKLK